VEERSLESLDLTRSIEPFQGDDFMPAEATHRNGASVDDFAVEEDRTRPAVTGLAANLCCGQSEIVSQHIGETPQR
jgi:hypothetical protein